jgi:hypothetical protein
VGQPGGAPVNGRHGATFTLHGKAAGEGFSEAAVWVNPAGQRVDDIADWVERAIARLGAAPGGDVTLNVTVWRDGPQGPLS